MRRAVLALALGLSCGRPPPVAADSAVEHAALPPAPAPAPPLPASPLAIEPLLDGDLAPGATLWARGDAAGARQALLAATTGAAPTERVLAARLVAALAALETGEPAAARTELEALAASWPLVAPLALAHAAQAALDAGAPEDAEALAARVAVGSAWTALALQVAADAAFARRDYAAAETRYQGIVDDPAAPRRLQARRRLGESIAHQIRSGARDPRRAARAIEELRAVAIAVAGTGLGDELDARVQGLSRQLSRRDRARLAPTAADALRRAEGLLGAQKNEQAEHALEALLRELPRPSDLRCPAQLHLGESVMRQRDRTRAAPLLEAAVLACRGHADEPRALYLAGKVQAAIGRHEDAIGRFAEIEEHHTDSSLTDDARLLAAQSALALGRVEDFRDRLRTLPDTYPTGDMVGEALWQLAWQAWQAGGAPRGPRGARLPGDARAARDRLVGRRARPVLARARPRTPRADGRRPAELAQGGPRLPALVLHAPVPLAPARRRREGRAGYLGRAGRRPRARARLARGARGGGAGQRGVRPGEAPAGCRPRRAGEPRAAALGIDAPGGGAESRWLAAYLLDRAGDPARAHDILRRQAPEFARRWPTGDARRKWLVAYPRAFRELVEAAAHEQGLPPALVFAIVREESGFRPGIESWANAVGLAQLMPATARRFAQPLGLAVTPETLREPATNLRIGAAFLALLSGQFAASPLLVPAGYNAGETAVKRWVAAAPGAELDEIVESIPYDETRGYTKRVAASWATYHALYGATARCPSWRCGCRRPRARREGARHPQATVVVRERVNGTLERLRLASVPARDVLLGVTLAQVSGRS